MAAKCWINCLQNLQLYDSPNVQLKHQKPQKFQIMNNVPTELVENILLYFFANAVWNHFELKELFANHITEEVKGWHTHILRCFRNLFRMIDNAMVF